MCYPALTPKGGTGDSDAASHAQLDILDFSHHWRSRPLRAAANPTLLFDMSNGKVLYAEEADKLWYPASLTKIMTAYVVFEALNARRSHA